MQIVDGTYALGADTTCMSLERPRDWDRRRCTWAKKGSTSYPGMPPLPYAQKVPPRAVFVSTRSLDTPRAGAVP